MEKIILFFAFLFLNFNQIYCQKFEFDHAINIIYKLHSNRLKREFRKIVVDDKIGVGDFDIRLFYATLVITNPPLIEAVNNESAINIETKKVFKTPMYFNPIESSYYSKRKLRKLNNGILIKFVKFDGRFLRIDATFGVDFSHPSQLNTRYIYQFEFKNKYVKSLNWMEVFH